MTTTTFALIRHGQTDWNAAWRIQGATDIPLNDVGRGQAADAVVPLADYEWDFIVSSPLSRAAETADVIGRKLSLGECRRIPNLTERNYGPAEGLSAGPELEALRFPGGFHGAEAEHDVATRGTVALRQLASDHPGARIIVVAHGTLIRLSLAHALERRIGNISNATLNLVHHHETSIKGAAAWQLDILNGESLVADVATAPLPL